MMQVILKDTEILSPQKDRQKTNAIFHVAPHDES